VLHSQFCFDSCQHTELALKTRKEILDNDNPDIANSMQCLATVYRQMTGTAQNAAKAGTLFYEAVELLRKSVGTEHLSTATALNNLGLYYKIEGSFNEALEAYEEAYAVREKILQSEHPDSITVKHNMVSFGYQPTARMTRRLMLTFSTCFRPSCTTRWGTMRRQIS
jgi:tetratricopeptide (TPR) repeat protein